VPGEPTNVRASTVNSTTIHVSWKPPAEKDRNGIIRGYHIHVHEVKDEVRSGEKASKFSQIFIFLTFFFLQTLKGKSFLNEPMKFEILDGILDYNISGWFRVLL
jgi:receptor-type tyrosine-protein phosphatase F